MASLFSRQRNTNMEKALFDWPIVLHYDVKEISRKFFGHEVCLPARSLSQPKPRCVCIRFIHQSNRSISVCLLFLFCSRVFISRPYENRSNCLHEKQEVASARRVSRIIGSPFFDCRITLLAGPTVVQIHSFMARLVGSTRSISAYTQALFVQAKGYVSTDSTVPKMFRFTPVLSLTPSPKIFENIFSYL